MKQNLNNFINDVGYNPYQLNTNKTDDDEICVLVFANCHNKYPLEKLSSKDLKSFIDFCKKIEKMTWKEIKIDEGFNYETPKHFNVNMPDLFPRHWKGKNTLDVDSFNVSTETEYHCVKRLETRENILPLLINTNQNS